MRTRRFWSVVFVVLVAVTGAAGGAAAANLVAWRQASAEPSADEARRLAAPGLPGTTLTFTWHDDVHDEHGHTSPGPRELPGQREANVPGPLTDREFAAAVWMAYRLFLPG